MNDPVDILDCLVVCPGSLDVRDDKTRDLAFILRESLRDEINVALGAYA